MSWIGVDDLRHWLNIAWERINSLRPPPSVDFSWRSTWPIPLYGLACVAHRRIRAWKPRCLPTLTTLGVPEIYGILALGHLAHIEANRLAKKVAEDSDLGFIRKLAEWAQHEYRRHPERFIRPTGSKEDRDLTVFLCRQPVDNFQAWKYDLRCSWTDERRRKAASALLARRLTVINPGVSLRDAALVALFVSEELGGHGIFRSSFLRDNKPLMVEFASLAFWSMLARWASASSGVLHTNAILQRYFIYILAFKWFGGRYCHYASIFGLGKPDPVAFQIGLSVLDWKVKYGKSPEADPGAMFANLGLPVPPWFGEV
ncbi:hypothetical protein LXA43DRAFT_124186 [Ganoderma leucocontextum]|nr:hypothetical protein LXA43DRAFT_124186 [Ganoderma leucocontextum]